MVFWAAVILTVTKVMGDIWNGTLRRELFALVIGIEVAVVLVLALVGIR